MLVLVAALLAACGGPAGATEQGIEGRYVLSGPGTIQDCSQLEEQEEREACEEANEPWTRPMAGERIEVRDSSDLVIATTVTDSDGAYRLELPAGDYLVCTLSCEGPITVTAGEFTSYELRLAVP